MKRDSWIFEKSDAGFERTKKKIGSVSEFLDCIQFKWEKWPKNQWKPQEKSPWFRGVEKESYHLIPRIYRGDGKTGWRYNANEAVDMRAEFARRATPFLNQTIPYETGEYFHLMQHYRFPTRLLDWTEGALIALYFAIQKNPRTPCVWMLNPSWLNYVNDVTIENEETEENKSLVLYTKRDAVREFKQDKIIHDHYLDEHKLAKFPVAVFPPHIDRRIVAQKSVFTIHGRLKKGFNVLFKKYPNAQICMLGIDSRAKRIQEMKTQLYRSGVTETTLFPDLEGLSRELQAEYGIVPQSSIPK